MGSQFKMKKGKTIIRLMKNSDLNKVAALYANIYAKVDIGEKWTRATAYKLMKHFLLKQPDLAFIALLNNKIVGGFVAGIKPWWDGNHLVDGEIFVDFNYHKRGIGSELSKAMYAKAIKKYKIAGIDFVTFSKNNFPLKWYKSMGFVVGRELIMINGDANKVMQRLDK